MLINYNGEGRWYPALVRVERGPTTELKVLYEDAPIDNETYWKRVNLLKEEVVLFKDDKPPKDGQMWTKHGTQHGRYFLVDRQTV